MGIVVCIYTGITLAAIVSRKNTKSGVTDGEIRSAYGSCIPHASWVTAIRYITSHMDSNYHASNMDSADHRRSEHIRNWLLAVIATIMVIAALKISLSVMLPLVFALFLIAVFWPLQRRLEDYVPRGAAAVLTLLTFILVMSLFCAALWFSIETAASKAPEYEQQFVYYGKQVQTTAASYGLTLRGPEESGSVKTLAIDVSKQLISFFTGSVLVMAFFVLGLAEVHAYRDKFNRSLGKAHSEEHWLEVAYRISSNFQRYIVVRTVIGLITGSLVALSAWIIGLDFALIWGLGNFLLNYIPTLGSIIGVVPPTLFALAQFQSVEMTLLVLLCVGGVQLIMGNYIDPLLQGRYLALSPLVVLFSVVLWGWVWGIVGAFISVPLTVGIVITCQQFKRTRWIATLLASATASPATSQVKISN